MEERHHLLINSAVPLKCSLRGLFTLSQYIIHISHGERGERRFETDFGKTYRALKALFLIMRTEAETENFLNPE